jgi:hypothetical protein
MVIEKDFASIVEAMLQGWGESISSFFVRPKETQRFESNNKWDVGSLVGTLERGMAGTLEFSFPSANFDKCEARFVGARSLSLWTIFQE